MLAEGLRQTLQSRIKLWLSFYIKNSLLGYYYYYPGKLSLKVVSLYQGWHSVVALQLITNPAGVSDMG